MNTPRGRSRIRLFVLLSSALVVASLAPLLVSDLVLIGRNRRALETLEEKYLTRSSSALADRLSAYYASASAQLSGAAERMRLAAQLTGKDPFTSSEGQRMLERALVGQKALVALRGFNLEGSGSGAGPETGAPAVDEQFRLGFEAARRGERYSGKPFWVPSLGTPVAVLAEPVADATGRRQGVVEALVSWEPILQEFRGEARREVRATLVDRAGAILFPFSPRGQVRRHPSTLVADFTRFPARVTRSERTRRGDVLASIAPVGEPDWGVLLERDLDLAFASVSLMERDTLLWSAVALAGALLVGIVFARRLSQPIAQLAASTRAISEGEYGATVEVGGTAEIAALSASFNRMSESIRDAFEKVQRAARENRELFLSSIRALAEAIDAKDPYTRGHSERVARYASAIAEQMDLTAEQVEKVRLAALLHDVGKIGVDDRIIRKPTALTEEEFEVMKTHPAKGAAIMGAIPQLADVIPGMKHHHEKWEGGGYPDGLKGEAIPMQARIVTVADTFDAMTTTRPYQKAMEIGYVIERIKSFSGIRYDPVVVEAFLRACAIGKLVPPAREEILEPAEELETPLRRAL
ncbi:MAG: HD domain-containing phosphohydrolase [Acidobacteriota bacterium]